MEDEIELEHSSLCRQVDRDGRSVQVEIYRCKGRDEDWLLEIVDLDTGASVVWDKPFTTDREALDFLLAAIDEEGLDGVIDDSREA